MNIEFVDPPLPSRRAWTAVLAVAAMAAVLFGAARLLGARADALREAWRDGERARAQPAPAPPRPAPPYAADARRALDRAALPVATALGELEGVSVVGIALQSIDVEAASRRVTVQLRCSRQAVLDDYLGQLNAGLPVPAWHVERLSVDDRAGAAAPQAPASGATPGQALAATLVRSL